MLFSSFEFIGAFLPVTLALYFFFGHRGNYRGAITILSAASLCFYGWHNTTHILILLSSIIFNYFIGLRLSCCEERNKKLLLITGVGINLAILGYFKYAIFILDNINYLFQSNFAVNNLIFPLGISFFTFGQIAYLVDVYKGITKEFNSLNYLLFVSFFPYIISGPITRHQEIIPQIENKDICKFNIVNLSIGLTFFIIGLAKKVIIADPLASYANPIFQAALAGRSMTFYDAWSGALAYSFQLYFDFSGYSEMALGIAKMLGIDLPINFNSPYKAMNISDFWRRWHITLSNFLRDYIYIPLGGNRQGKLRQYGNLIITMLLGGLWHGAAWTFVIWGGMHGIYLVINHQWHSLLKSKGIDFKKVPWWSVSVGCAITCIAVLLSWVIFRAESIESATLIIKTMSGFNGFNLSNSIVAFPKSIPLALIIFVWFAPNTQQWINNSSQEQNKGLTKYLGWQPNNLWGIVLGILLFMIIKTILDAPPTTFVYFNF